MKRLCCFLLALVMCLTAAGCADEEAPAPPEQASPSSTTVLNTDYDVTPHIRQTGDSVCVLSPDRTVSFELTIQNDQLTYCFKRDDTVFIEDSAMGLTLGSTAYGNGTFGNIEAVHRTDLRAINGRVAKADTPCIEAVIPVGAMTLELRVYDNGAAFRYIVEGNGARRLKSEETAFTLPAESTLWASTTHQFYETFPQNINPAVKPSDTLGLPVTAQLKNGSYVALTEGDLSHYPGIQLEWQKANRFTTVFLPGVYTLDGTVTTPWRIITVGDDLNELYNNTIIYQVNDAPDSALFADEQIKPGRAVWSWITGRNTASVTSDIMNTYTDHAAALGFEYNIIDEGWIDWSDRTLEDLAQKGDTFGVGQILWTGMTSGASYNGGISSLEEAKAYLDFVSARGMKGAKIDFFRDERDITMGVDVYEEILRYAASLGLVINFHGCNKPTGLDATYPNELNREAIYGLENMNVYNYAVQAQAFVTQPFTRNLAGHADFTPAAESAFHMAQLVLADAPMQAFGSDPETLLSLDCLEMIKSIPTVWQQTVVLPESDIGKAAVMARKGHNASWYVGGINYIADTEQTELLLSDFLDEGTYRYELWTDDGNRFATQTGTVTANDTLTVPFEKMSGFIVRFDRITLSQYGGEISEPVTLTVHDDATVVRYTLDGSKPTDSSPVWNSGEAITLTDSGTLTVAVYEGGNTPAFASYRFNML